MVALTYLLLILIVSDSYLVVKQAYKSEIFDSTSSALPLDPSNVNTISVKGIVFLSAVRADPSLVIYVGIVFLSASERIPR